MTFGDTFGGLGLGAVLWLYGGEGAPEVTGPYCFTVVAKTAGPVATLAATAGPVATMAKTAGPVVTVGGCLCD